VSGADKHFDDILQEHESPDRLPRSALLDTYAAA